jgi:GTP-binding protein YchF
MQIGLVGLQYSGKTTLFNTLGRQIGDTSLNVKSSADKEIVKVPDKRLDRLTEIFKPKKKVNAIIELFDFPGLRMSDDGKLKLTSEFQSDVIKNKALLYVIRQFQNDSVPHPMDEINPLKDIKFLETEFLLTDYGFLISRIEKLEKDYQKINEDSLKKEIDLLKRCLHHTESELPLRSMKLSERELKTLSGYQLFTLKPAAAAVNFDDSSIDRFESVTADIKNDLAGEIEVIPFSAQIENELALLGEEERMDFMSEYGIKESALDRIIRSLYKLLNLHSFFTVGDDECRAWTIRTNYNAQQAAGTVHTDFFKRFIRAEVVGYDDFIEHGSIQKCKDTGVWRLEGKEYIVKDGDIINIRHN